ncbi:class I SAM-dependent methyltransferase [Streptomyces kronopolitis]
MPDTPSPTTNDTTSGAPCAPHGFTTATMTAAYSDALAGVYDEIYPSTPDLDDITNYLLTLTHSGARILELGVGTGRIALPLTERGFAVHGVDASEQMLAQLAAKDSQQHVTTSLGDFTALDLERTFDVVLAPFNALCCAMTVDEQIAMMHAVARYTAPDGHAVVETFDPSDYHVQRRNEVTTYPLTGGTVIESLNVLPASQNMMVLTTLFLEGRPPLSASTIMRYLWPSELDLLAAAAGLELVSRYAGWRQQPFDGGDSRKMCVSTYRKLT